MIRIHFPSISILYPSVHRSFSLRNFSPPRPLQQQLHHWSPPPFLRIVYCRILNRISCKFSHPCQRWIQWGIFFPMKHNMLNIPIHSVNDHFTPSTLILFSLLAFPLLTTSGKNLRSFVLCSSLSFHSSSTDGSIAFRTFSFRSISAVQNNLFSS